ncbi:DNA polymerase III subunit delta [Brevibacillus sp. B_LB10_24]|uniref:DNA polymerase III subunit delta n=1 Tax=Brevibacillus sp. B_LB10_24 TaxID=3380645 RepID=UPI0038B76539
MPLHEVVREIKAKRIAPLYVLYGAETFLMEEFVKLLRSELIDPEYADLNVSQYDCAETPLSAILQDAETLPFLAEHRLVLADNAFFLTGVKPPSKVEVDADELIRYLDEPAEYTAVILRVNADKLDERKKLVKALHQKAVVVPFQPLQAADLYGWVERRAKQYQARIERPEAMKLVERVGSDLRLLDKELEKMALYTGNQDAVITDQVIELLASRTLEQNVFALVEAVVGGQLNEAFRILYDCLKTGEEPIRLLALLARQIRMLLHIKMWAPRGYTQQQLAGMLKVHPYAVKKAMEQARHFDEAGLRRLLGILAEEDFRMKSGQVDKRIALEVFMTQVAAQLQTAKAGH